MPAVTRSPLILACLAATWFVWGSTYLAIKFALVSFPPFLQMGTRFLISGTLLLLWAWWRRQRMPTLVQWRNATIVGALMLAGNVGGVAYAEQSVASGLVVAFIAIGPALIAIASLPFGIRPLANTRPALASSNSFVNPVIAMLLGIYLGGETVTSHEWLAVGIIVLGVTVLILGRR